MAILVLALPLMVWAEVVDRTIVTVNSDAILKSDVTALVADLKKPGRLDDGLFLDGMTADSLAKSEKQQIDYLINESIMNAEIKNQNLTATADRIEQELTNIAKSYNMSLEDFLKASEKQGVNISESRRFLKMKIEKQALLEKEILSRMRISDDEIYQEYLRRNPQAPKQIDEFTLAHIFFNPKTTGEATTLELANSVLRKLHSGVSFESLVEQYTEDKKISKDGLLGTFKTGEFIPEIEEQIKNLKAGEVTGIVRSRKGFHIVKVISRKNSRDSRFEKVMEPIRAELTEKAFRKQLTAWLLRKRDEAQINYFN